MVSSTFTLIVGIITAAYIRSLFDSIFSLISLQTLFRLPLRNSSHINASSILKTTRITAQYVRDKIVRPYWNSAKQALIFTKMESIVTFSRDPTGLKGSGWAISASRDPVQTTFNFSSQLIHLHTGGAEPQTEDFKVVFIRWQLKDLPPEFTTLIEPHRLRSPINVGLAAPLAPTNANHNLFSTLPLPMTTNLPVHLTGTFILTPDRRHIRLDDNSNAESRYNRWLLSEVAPPVYLFLLEDLLRTQASLGNDAWWPGNTTPDSVSKYVVDAFYSTHHLGSTKRRVCASVFDVGQQFRPCDVLVGGNEPARVSKILGLLNTPHVVRLPAKIRDRCAGVMKTIDAAFVATEIRQKTRSLVSLFSNGQLKTGDIQSLANFIAEDNATDFIGLPLLPLADSKLVVLQTYGSTVHYVWKPSHPDRVLFRPEFLVHPDFVADKFLDKGLNVTKFTSVSIENLIKEHFAEGAERQLKPEEEKWVATFWAEYPHFGLPAEAKSFPLVRTSRPGHYISLHKCWTNSVLLTSSSEPFWLCNVLSELGASIVQRDSKELPKALREALKTLPTFDFVKVLEYFLTIESTTHRRFAKLDPSIHAEFAEWARSQITRTPDRLFSTASSLPIWKKLQKEEAVTLHAAWELKMLPFGISRDIATRFIGVPSVEYNQSLVHLKVVPMNFNQFW
jgi:hypothetical protein